MPTPAAYDEIADWYEYEFLAGHRTTDDDSLGINRALVDLLGAGSGQCLEIGCGTGANARRIGQLGWTPVGVDLSAGMLRHARAKLPIAQGDATRLPILDRSVSAVVAVMIHTDLPDYSAVLREVRRVLQPPNTVKAQMRRIYHKLNVDPRHGAIARAREWGLLLGWPGPAVTTPRREARIAVPATRSMIRSG